MNAAKPPTAGSEARKSAKKRPPPPPSTNRLPLYFITCLMVSTIPIVGPSFSTNLGLFGNEFLPAGITALFALWAISNGRKSTGETAERLGDASYYLGFLLTLLSLVSSLYLTGEPSETPVHLLERLGIALSTTIVGLLGRIFIVQFQKSPIDHIDAADEGLSSAVSSYTSALRLGTQHIEETLLDIQRSLNTLSGDIEKQVRETSEQYHATVSAMTEAHQSGQKELIDGYRKKLDSITLIPKKTMDQFDRVSDSLSNRLSGLDQSLETLTETMGQAGASVSAFKDLGQSSLAVVQAQSEEAVRAIAGLSTQSADGVAEAADRLQASVDQATQAFDGIGGPLSTVAAELQGAVPQFKAMTEILVDIGNVAAAVEGQMHAIEALETAVEQAGHSMTRLGETAQSHSTGLEALSKENEALSGAFAAQRDRFLADQQALLEQLRKQRDEAQKVAQDVADQFAGLVGRIDEELRA